MAFLYASQVLGRCFSRNSIKESIEIGSEALGDYPRANDYRATNDQRAAEEADGQTERNSQKKDRASGGKNYG